MCKYLHSPQGNPSNSLKLNLHQQITVKLKYNSVLQLSTIYSYNSFLQNNPYF